ncbi:MAG TPA: HupE/UreJ family protein [Vicinamibacterales bacterium]|nr:HupE/UreJ family protein [Vicinamibacterales bacterium]
MSASVISRSVRRAFLGVVALTTVIVVLVCGVTARAHEIGTTRVSVVLAPERTYDIVVVTDAAALVEKLGGGRSSATNLNPDRLLSRLVSADEDFRRRVTIAFDASGVRPVISYAVAPGTNAASPALATIRLAGPIPAGANTFSWRYAWTFASYALTVRSDASANPVTEWLEGGERSSTFALTAPAPEMDRMGVARRYVALGFTHIVPYGLDHVLFVLGIYLLSGRARSVLVQVSAFTIAHSITLGLSLYGVLAAPPRIVEPMIAVSIAYVAVENIFRSELKSWRVALVFAFGLLHGLGFAGALKELGLPRSEFLTALLTFNLGVEAGQLAVIGAAFLLIGWHCAHRVWYRTRIVVPASALIACVAVYWTIERLWL